MPAMRSKMENMNTNETPQTDAWSFWNKDGDIELVYASISRSIEKELNDLKKSQSDVEILREQLVKYRELANEIFSYTSHRSVYHMQHSDWKDKLKTPEDEIK